MVLFCTCRFSNRNSSKCFPGYDGNGVSCIKTSPCASGPCFPSAQCITTTETMDSSGFRCQCPSNMVGDGIGLAGCQYSNSTPCASNPCLNQGTCQATSNTQYTCHCVWGFAGSRCETPTPCVSSPCQYGGTCNPMQDGTYACNCVTGRYGQNCQQEADGIMFGHFTVNRSIQM